MKQIVRFFVCFPFNIYNAYVTLSYLSVQYKSLNKHLHTNKHHRLLIDRYKKNNIIYTSICISFGMWHVSDHDLWSNHMSSGKFPSFIVFSLAFCIAFILHILEKHTNISIVNLTHKFLYRELFAHTRVIKLFMVSKPFYSKLSWIE